MTPLAVLKECSEWRPIGVGPSRRLKGCIAASAALAFAGCGLEPLGPSTFSSDSLHVEARIEPSDVYPGDSADVLAVFRNETRDSIYLRLLGGCTFDVRVVDRQSGARVGFQGTGQGSGCLPEATPFGIAGRDSLLFTSPLTARVGDQPAEAGEYVVLLDFHGIVPSLEAGFTVR